MSSKADYEQELIEQAEREAHEEGRCEWPCWYCEEETTLWENDE
jgi:hypothetical protein